MWCKNNDVQNLGTFLVGFISVSQCDTKDVDLHNALHNRIIHLALIIVDLNHD